MKYCDCCSVTLEITGSNVIITLNVLNEKKISPPLCPARIPACKKDANTKKNVVTQTRCNKPIAEGSDCCDTCTETRKQHNDKMKAPRRPTRKQLEHLGPLGLGWHGIRDETIQGGGLFPYYSHCVNDDGTERDCKKHVREHTEPKH